MLKGEGGGLHGRLLTAGTIPAALFVDVVNVLIDPVSLLLLEAHDGLQLLALSSPRLSQLFEAFERLAGDGLVTAEPQKVEVHVEAKRQRNFKFVRHGRGRTAGQSAPNYIVVETVAVDLVVDVTVDVTTREAAVFAIFGRDSVKSLRLHLLRGGVAIFKTMTRCMAHLEKSANIGFSGCKFDFTLNSTLNALS